jgi:hypothetical protein
MVGFILACLGHRYRAVASSNPALPTTINLSLVFVAVSISVRTHKFALKQINE